MSETRTIMTLGGHSHSETPIDGQSHLEAHLAGSMAKVGVRQRTQTPAKSRSGSIRSTGCQLAFKAVVICLILMTWRSGSLAVNLRLANEAMENEAEHLERGQQRILSKVGFRLLAVAVAGCSVHDFPSSAQAQTHAKYGW